MAHKRPKPKGQHQQRTCIICRNSTDKRELLRFVIKDGELRWDVKHNISGRGAYVHRKVTCWSKMREIGRWQHNLRMERGGTGNLGSALADLMEQVRGEIEGLGTVETVDNAKVAVKRKVRI